MRRLNTARYSTCSSCLHLYFPAMFKLVCPCLYIAPDIFPLTFYRVLSETTKANSGWPCICLADHPAYPTVCFSYQDTIFSLFFTPCLWSWLYRIHLWNLLFFFFILYHSFYFSRRVQQSAQLYPQPFLFFFSFLPRNEMKSGPLKYCGFWRSFLQVYFIIINCRISLNLLTLTIESPRIYTSLGVPISVTGIAQVKIESGKEEMLHHACQQFLGKSEEQIKAVVVETLEGHQRAIMGEY